MQNTEPNCWLRGSICNTSLRSKLSTVFAVRKEFCYTFLRVRHNMCEQRGIFNKPMVYLEAIRMCIT